MKSAKFKNIYIKNRKKIFLAILLSAILIVSISSHFATLVSKNTISYAKKEIEKKNMQILSEAFSIESKNDIEVENLIKVIKNKNDEIVEVDFNLQACSDILKKVIGFINEEFTNYNYVGYRLDVPLGFANDSPLLINLGPKIPIKVELSDYAFGNVNTVIREFGINNALIEIYLEVKLKTNILYPLNEETSDSSYESLIASKIITGTVPEFYGGTINSKSSDVFLPLN